MEKDIDCLEEEQMSNDMKPNQSDDQPCIIENYQDVHHDLGNNDNIQSINNNEIHQIDVDQLQPCIEDYQDQDASVDNGNNNIDNNNIVDDHHPVLVGGSYSGGKSNSSNISIGSGNGSSSSSSDGVIDPPDNNSLVDLQKSTNLFNTTSVSLAEELSEQQFRFDNQKKLHDSIDLEVGGGKKQLNYSINNNNNNNNNGAGRESESDFQLRQYFENSQRMALSNGNKPKKMGISVTDLTVVGKGADISIIEDLFTPIKFIFNPFKWKRNNGTTFNILNNINMFCRDGEMVLVLGRPGAGCSTLLRVIANQRDTYVNVGGKVSYGGLDSKEWASKYRGEAIYVPEEDSHYPTLTLKQTIDFALKCKTPGNRVPYDAKRTFRQKVYDLLANMYGLTAQSHTMVGNEIVRGLSGGERKRATITEATVSGAPINCWDCSTRGLDAASALDYAKSLRIMTDTLHKTTVATFYQASESIYQLFDKVLVLEKGRCIYFGGIADAKPYFQSLGFGCEPRKSTPDFLTGITNPQERIVREGFEETAPQISSEYEQAWLRSEQCARVLAEQHKYDVQLESEQPHLVFAEEVRDQKSRTASNSNPYTTSFLTQVRALTLRQAQLIWGDRPALASRYISVLVQSFVYGSLFYLQKHDLSGLFTRGGAIFGSILFNAFLSQGELTATFVGRRALQKQKSYAMYRPSAFHIAQVLNDIPVVFAQVVLYSVIAYFMFGFQYGVSQFIIWIVVMVGLTLGICNFFRALGFFSPSLYVSQHVMVVYLLLLLCYTGYSVPYQKMHPWLQWFFWFNPLSYGYKALMANEFKDVLFECYQTAIPYGAYNDPRYRTCAIPGATPGILQVSGEAYLQAGYSFRADDISYNTVIVYIWWISLTILNMFAIEFFDWTKGGYTKKVYKQGKAPKINDLEEEKSQAKIVKEANENVGKTLEFHGGVFSWKNIKYTVPVKGEKRLILDDVEGWIRPGQMTALVGSTGAGKTTLLDVLAKRKTIGALSGDIRLNGRPLGIDFERITGYVEQMDIFNPNLTVREALRFSAKLRQDPHVPLEEKFEYVERVLEMMEMKHLGDALVGCLESGVGISIEERKRLNIGIELVAKPHILFLDEPTSGLDSQSSYNIIKFIRKLADSGMPLVCTIHQPSSVLFEYFDRLLLLAKGGKTVYFGDIGHRSSTLINYFTRHGIRPCLESENPAEYILEATGAGFHGNKSNGHGYDWSSLWKSSPEYKATLDELEKIENTITIMDPDDMHRKPREFATPLWYQIWEVYKRMNIIFWRDPYYSFGSFMQSMMIGTLVGLTFYNLKNSSSDMYQRIFFIFQALFIGILLIFVALPQVFQQKIYFRREYASRYYGCMSFTVAMVSVQLPYLIFTSSLFYICTFWLAGFGFEVVMNLYFWAYFVIFLFFCVSLGQAIGAICETMFLANFVVPVILVFLFLFSGVMIPESQIPRFWREWVYRVMPTRYFMEGVVTTILKDVNIKCTTADLVKFHSPEGSTCEEYTWLFSMYSTGYVQQLDSSPNDCGYCLYSTGEEFYSTLGWKDSNRLRNLIIVSCYWLFNVFLIGIFVYISRKPKR